LHDGRALRSESVVLTTGTFLRGRTHVGDDQQAAGRIGEAPSIKLAERLADLALPLGRLKTGTPPRLKGRTIDWDALELQEGDESPEPFSVLSPPITRPQVACGITRTNHAVHEIIRQNLDRAPIYAGAIEGRGPRYCPSIEDKVVRFADREEHQVFLEPEGLTTDTVYPNGISTSLPRDVQCRLVRAIRGLEKAEIEQYGYAVEYDYVDPRALNAGLGVKALPGLFLAGQINGTTGYEEAAAQGLVAGLNAARQASGQDLTIFDRSQSYIGVMLDDLTRHGVSEPYRMFTSRAEYRLSLRADNAPERLTEFGVRLGCIGAERIAGYTDRQTRLAAARERLEALIVTPKAAETAGLRLNQDGQRRSAFALLSYPEIGWVDLERLWPALKAIDPTTQRQIESEAKYAVYLDRQRAEIAQLQRDDDLLLGDWDDPMAGLSNELFEKIRAIRPRTIRQARMIEGMTPAALTMLAARARKQRRVEAVDCVPAA